MTRASESPCRSSPAHFSAAVRSSLDLPAVYRPRKKWPSLRQCWQAICQGTVLTAPTAAGIRVPGPQGTPFGLEIEVAHSHASTVYGRLYSALGAAGMMNASTRRYSNWEVHEEPVSEDVGGEFSWAAEVVSPILNFGHLTQLNQVVTLLGNLEHEHNNSASAARRHRGCGIHLQLDLSDVSNTEILRLWSLVYHFEPAIYSMFGTSEYRKSRYARPIDAWCVSGLTHRLPDHKEALFDVWRQGANQSCVALSMQNVDIAWRDHAFNLANMPSRGTVELRYFESRPEHGYVNLVVQFGQALMRRAKSKTIPVSSADFIAAQQTSVPALRRVLGMPDV